MVFIFHEKKKKNCPRKRPIILHVWVIGVEKKSSLEGNFKELLLKEEWVLCLGIFIQKSFWVIGTEDTKITFDPK